MGNPDRIRPVKMAGEMYKSNGNLSKTADYPCKMTTWSTEIKQSL